MKTTLLKLHKFLSDHKIEYIVTGTTALDILGVHPHYSPDDLDIKVFNLTEEQAKKLQELADLSGLENKDYEMGTKCFTFTVCDCKVNAIVVKSLSYNDVFKMSVPIRFADEHGCRSTIYVQRVYHALYDKMLLKRNKDREYMLNLIASLARL